MTQLELEYDVKVFFQRLRGRGGFLPKGPLRALIERREEVLPALRQELELLAQNPEESRRVSGNLSFFALYLLAYFGDVKSAPALKKACKLDGEWLDAWLGEAVDEDFSRILASVMKKEPKLLIGLVDDKGLWDIMRATALEALFILSCQGHFKRDDLLKFCHTILERRHREDSYFMSAVIVILKRLYPDREMLSEIHAAFSEETVELMVIQESEIWAMQEEFTEEEWLAKMKDEFGGAFVDPITHLEKLERFLQGCHPGRNDTCPCGSANKYKECCA